MEFAKRVEYLAPSSIRQVMGVALRLIQEGKKVYQLNIGQPDISFHPAFEEGLINKAKSKHLGYSPYIGETCLRETFARYLNHHFDRRGVKHLVVEKENVHVTAGASQGLVNTFLAIINPGDEVLCFEPYFQPYYGFLAVAGGILKSVPTYAEKSFVMPTNEEIETHITPKTKAILVNSPCNPSGKIFTEEEITRLARLALKHNLYLIGDEVYREMILGDKESFSLLQVELEPELMEKYKNSIIIIDSASKTFSLCGARVGFVVARAHIIDAISKVTAHTVASVSDLLQHAVANAYEKIINDETFITNLRNTYKQRLEVAISAINEYLPTVIAPKPEGAFYLMLQFQDIENTHDFAMFLLEDFNLGGETVAITPAESFYRTKGRGRNEIRLALVLEPEKIKRSIQIIAEAYKAYKKHKSYKLRPSL